MTLRNRLLGTLVSPAYEPGPLSGCTNAVACSIPQPCPEVMLANCKAMIAEAPQFRRGSGPAFAGIPIEANPDVPVGSFKLREPGRHPYTVALPMASLRAFYRSGDILMLAPETIEAIPVRPAPHPGQTR